MRKQMKDKRRCCRVCKPHKRGWNNRWTARDRALARAHAREIQEVKRR